MEIEYARDLLSELRIRRSPNQSTLVNSRGFGRHRQRREAERFGAMAEICFRARYRARIDRDPRSSRGA